MPVDPRRTLMTLGYEVDKRGNVRESPNQLALLSIEDTEEGGVLRVHGTTNSFFYGGDPLLAQMNLSFPVKVTRRYVYFKGREDDYRITMEEFAASLSQALMLYNQMQKTQVGG
ncbi:hypothetical protein HYS54_01415 [Candidatus Micrarchaeota archaeon]|nr:hypothetical protein [Candidatus Micrarchaeota archaeon]